MSPKSMVEATMAAQAQVNGLYENLYGHVRSINVQVEQLPSLKEESRKLYRFIKRAEVLVSDLQPYIRQDPSAALLALPALKAVEASLMYVLGVLAKIAAKGPVSGYMEADRLLNSFTVASQGLEAAVGALPLAQLAIAEEAGDEAERLRVMLRRAKYDLPPAHQQAVATFRTACDQLRAPFEVMQSACSTILQAVTGQPVLTKEGFDAAINELREECGHLLRSDHSGDEFYLRMMMDLVRIQHVQSDTPLEYLCPLTLKVMEDPVVMFETGHSYGRAAITDWFSSGHKFCPRSGVKIKSLNVSSNHNLKEAIKRWRSHADLQLSFRPVIASLTAVQQERVAAAAATSAAAAAASAAAARAAEARASGGPFAAGALASGGPFAAEARASGGPFAAEARAAGGPFAAVRPASSPGGSMAPMGRPTAVAVAPAAPLPSAAAQLAALYAAAAAVPPSNGVRRSSDASSPGDPPGGAHHGAGGAPSTSFPAAWQGAADGGARLSADPPPPAAPTLAASQPADDDREAAAAPAGPAEEPPVAASTPGAGPTAAVPASAAMSAAPPIAAPAAHLDMEWETPRGLMANGSAAAAAAVGNGSFNHRSGAAASTDQAAWPSSHFLQPDSGSGPLSQLSQAFPPSGTSGGPVPAPDRWAVAEEDLFEGLDFSGAAASQAYEDEPAPPAPALEDLASPSRSEGAAGERPADADLDGDSHSGGGNPAAHSEHDVGRDGERDERGRWDGSAGERGSSSSSVQDVEGGAGQVAAGGSDGGGAPTSAGGADVAVSEGGDELRGVHAQEVGLGAALACSSSATSLPPLSRSASPAGSWVGEAPKAGQGAGKVLMAAGGEDAVGQHEFLGPR